jgi:hypothetical protein
MPYIIVNKHREPGFGLHTRAYYGPFATYDEAEAYNADRFPVPEWNNIKPLFAPEGD